MFIQNMNAYRFELIVWHRFDIEFNIQLIFFKSSKSHANCDFFAFSLIIELIIEKSSNWLHRIIFIRFRFRFLTSSRVLWHFQFQLWFVQSFNYESSKSYKKIAWRTAWKIAWRIAWKIAWRKIFTTCMHILLKNWIYDKKYMKWAHETYKFVCKECIFEIFVVETSIWKKKIVSRFQHICQHTSFYRFRRLEWFENRYYTFYII